MDRYFAPINLFLYLIMIKDVLLQTFGNRILGVMAWFMPLSVAISTFGSANGTLFAAGRLCFAASREGHLLDCLSYVHVRRFTPAPGLIFHSLVAGIKFNLDQTNEREQTRAICFDEHYRTEAKIVRLHLFVFVCLYLFTRDLISQSL